MDNQTKLLTLEKVVEKYLDTIAPYDGWFPKSPWVKPIWSTIENKFIDPKDERHFKTWCGIKKDEINFKKGF